MNKAWIHRIGSMGMILFLLPFFVTAQVRYSNEFLNLGAGARGLGMANTQTALATDATAVYWNPAGLAHYSKESWKQPPYLRRSAMLMHAEYFAGIAAYDYAGFAWKTDTRQSLGVNLLRFAIEDIPNTTLLVDDQGNIDYSRISYFTEADWALMLSYAREMLHRNDGGMLSLGGSVKVIRRRIGDFAGAWGFGLDFGMHYMSLRWQFGAVLHDVTTTFNAWSYHLSEEERAAFISTGNELPENGMEYTLPHLSLGAAWLLPWKEHFSTLFSLDADAYFDGKRHALLSGNSFSLDPHFGVETGYKEIVFLRAGIGNFQHETDFDNSEYTSCQINAGLGVCIKKRLYVDYAFTNLGNVSVALYSHIFSLRLAF
ncbi:MAG: PorV/PorQ family protein [Bacteroidales bacterium]|nr:PorV/PorQ family protein [Bacteroidales bacterium]